MRVFAAEWMEHPMLEWSKMSLIYCELYEAIYYSIDFIASVSYDEYRSQWDESRSVVNEAKKKQKIENEKE